jgi:hypothetical protein
MNNHLSLLSQLALIFKVYMSFPRQNALLLIRKWLSAVLDINLQDILQHINLIRLDETLSSSFEHLRNITHSRDAWTFFKKSPNWGGDLSIAFTYKRRHFRPRNLPNLSDSKKVCLQSLPSSWPRLTVPSCGWPCL